VTYGELWRQGFSLPVNANAKRKEPREWTVLGKPMPRVDLPAMATAQLEYVHNVRVPGMVHGAVVRPPEVGAALEGVDEASVRNLPGSSRWSSARTSSASSPKAVAGDSSGGGAESDVVRRQRAAAPGGFYDYLRTQPSRDTLVVDSQTWTHVCARATIVKATYRHPYQMHGSMGSRAQCRRAGPIGSRCGRPRIGLSDAQRRRRRCSVSRGTVRVVFTRGSGATGSTAPTPCRTTRR
jgi:hypothetical protein